MEDGRGVSGRRTRNGSPSIDTALVPKLSRSELQSSYASPRYMGLPFFSDLPGHHAILSLLKTAKSAP